MGYRLRSGREVDTSCPHMSQCWADQACLTGCPPTALDALRAAARGEHECGLLPHTDPEVAEMCPVCRT